MSRCVAAVRLDAWTDHSAVMEAVSPTPTAMAFRTLLERFGPHFSTHSELRVWIGRLKRSVSIYLGAVDRFPMARGLGVVGDARSKSQIAGLCHPTERPAYTAKIGYGGAIRTIPRPIPLGSARRVRNAGFGEAPAH